MQHVLTRSHSLSLHLIRYRLLCEMIFNKGIRGSCKPSKVRYDVNRANALQRTAPMSSPKSTILRVEFSLHLQPKHGLLGIDADERGSFFSGIGFSLPAERSDSSGMQFPLTGIARLIYVLTRVQNILERTSRVRLQNHYPG
jgi:hypothetical protein